MPLAVMVLIRSYWPYAGHVDKLPMFDTLVSHVEGGCDLVIERRSIPSVPSGLGAPYEPV